MSYRPVSRTGRKKSSKDSGNSHIPNDFNVQERPITQQGLGDLKTTVKGSRHVHDKSYFIVQLKNKIKQIVSETEKIKEETNEIESDQGNYLTYKKRAECIASEIKQFQDDLFDYNIVIDKKNKEGSFKDIMAETNELLIKNEQNSNQLDDAFEDKTRLEEEIEDKDEKLMKEKYSIQEIIENMATNLLQEINALKLKKKEMTSKSTDQDAEKNKDLLLNDIKKDNITISSIERENRDLTKKIQTIKDDIAQMNIDIEENRGDQKKKYDELKRREAILDLYDCERKSSKFKKKSCFGIKKSDITDHLLNEFFEDYEGNKDKYNKKIKNHRESIENMLFLTSEKMQKIKFLPTKQVFNEMKQDLKLKEDEVSKSELTAIELSHSKIYIFIKLEEMDESYTLKIETLKSDLKEITKNIKETQNYLKSEELYIQV
ncbi:hypothetical protein A3Q56_05437 [Intoshia linei]|uniref:Uncharacterized protein n=1 Tax=Intoshia linei TaxID=1819745 RepID=A0A177AXU6_9BILA|nr:hypothetical protein A3Q56_05437 [Intoshia linei]